MVEPSSQARLQGLEVEPALLGREETLAQRLLDSEKQQKKPELLSQERCCLQRSAEKRLAELRAQKAQLEASERLEQEVDLLTLQAAGIQHGEAKKDLLSPHHAADAPAATRGRLSLRLARRLLCLQRQNTSLERELDSHRLKSQLPAGEPIRCESRGSSLVEAASQRQAEIRAWRRPSAR